MIYFLELPIEGALTVSITLTLADYFGTSEMLFRTIMKFKVKLTGLNNAASANLLNPALWPNG